MSETTYYQRKREIILSRAKGYYENNKELLSERAKNKYRIIWRGKKYKKRVWKKRYHNIKKLKEYQKNYRQPKKHTSQMQMCQ